MVQTISWQEPVGTAVTKVEISKSDNYYGSYTVSTTINATSDGQPKTSSNSWVVSYTDSAGAKTNWYKIRFYDGTNYSDYSDPVSSDELVYLCSVDDVKKVIDTVGRWTDAQILDAIIFVDDYVYTEFGKPLKSTVSDIGKIDDTIQRVYYVGEEDIYKVDRVFYGTSSKTEFFLEDDFTTSNKYGMVRLFADATTGVTLSTQSELEIQFVPKIFHQLATYYVCKHLLEQLDITSAGKTSKELEVIEKRIEGIESILKGKWAFSLSSNFLTYDGVYGVNKSFITQDHRANNFISSVAW